MTLESPEVRAPAESRLRQAYGFEEVALVPGAVTAEPAEVDLSVEIGVVRAGTAGGRPRGYTPSKPLREHAVNPIRAVIIAVPASHPRRHAARVCRLRETAS